MTRSIVMHATSADRAIPALRSLRRFLRNRGDGVRGVVAIEFAVIALLLVVMTIGAVDFGMGFYRRMQVDNAAQAGAQYAIMHGFDGSKISTGVTGATTFTGIAASPAPRQFCGCPSATGVTEQAASPPCTSSCSDGSTSGTYVNASAQGTYDTILRYPALIPNSFTFTAQSTVRIP
jgi:Flp pilus assembly protein TadG